MFNFLKIIQLISFFSLFIIQSTFAVIDSTNSSELNYPFNQNQSGGLFLNKPSNFSQQTIYSPKNNNYSITNKIGTFSLGNSTFLSFEQFWKRDLEEKNKNYWLSKKTNQQSKNIFSSRLPKLYIPGQTFDRIFGGNSVDIRPQGSAELIFGLKTNRLDNPSLPEEQRKTTSFDFQEKIQMNVIGKIGEKLKLTTNFNTESTFDFENQMRLEYTGSEDEIIKKIEVGNVSLPLNGTLITGSQSLFGFKSQLQFGRTTITSILSLQKSTTSEVEVSGGAQTNEFDIYADQYEANKHFFLTQFFKEQYDLSLKNLPFVNSPINITKLEVWITNKTGTTNDTRNIVAFLDLGETNNNIYNTSFTQFLGGDYPDNSTNSMYDNLINNYLGIRDINQVNKVLGPLSSPQTFFFENGRDYEKLERARKLNPNEYSYHPQLGYISLNQSLNNDEVLAVAFQYTLGNQTYQVGELTLDGPTAPNSLIVKLIKGTAFSPNLPNWDLMMKNIYSLGAYQMSSSDFVLDVVYENTEESGAITNYIPEGVVDGIPLIKLLNLDELNQQQDNQSDGVFDFVEGITAISSNGKIIFPVREPFGSYLESKFDNQNIANKYVYKQLYDSTLIIAQQYPELNKFRLRGTYQASSGSEIRLGAMNVPQGSVTVTAGSQKLVENQDYTVDYMMGRVTIINEGILSSGIPIKISLENNSMFGIQNKTLVGIHADYEVNEDFVLGATMLNLTERPLTNKINAGDEPISNTIWGIDGIYQKDSPFLTKLIDNIPLIETKSKSRIIATTEFAHLIPGHHRAVGKNGVSYIDDFESSRTSLDIKNMGAWQLSSYPSDGSQNTTFKFPETEFSGFHENLKYGARRAKLAWYTIDPLFFRNSAITPPNINKNIVLENGNSIEQQSYHYVREVLETEVFPNKDPEFGSQITNMPILDIAYYPSKRGPYNYSVDGLNSQGQLDSPKESWGGIMRKLETNDFQSANIEFIEFWMMDPFNEEDGLGINHSGGDMYIHLGNISEDILKDGYKSFEHGFPTTQIVENVDTTAWGRVPTNFSIVEAFDNDPQSRKFQDIGLDGLSDDDEELFFDSIYISKLQSTFGTTSNAYLQALEDPSADNFHYYRGTDFDNSSTEILNRYIDYNNPDGNSVTTDESPESYPTAASNLPNSEDINKDYTLSETESYFQYKIELSPEMSVGNNYISDMFEAQVKTENGNNRTIKWYQFRVPVYQPDKIIGGIQDFKSIRFMRMAFTNFQEPIVLRFATFDLVRGEWRRYNFDLTTPGEYIPIDEEDATIFDVSAVNIEENGNRSPVNYVLPPGIEQEIDNTTTTLRQKNEQSLVLKVCDLRDGDSRAAYKTSDLDVRAYKKLKMFVHLEGAEDNLNYGDLSCFIRLGTDFTSNYYEYEIPLQPTPHFSTSSNEIWPEINNININFEDFQTTKQERNFNNESVTLPYEKLFGNGKITVVGNPNLSQVKTIMIGIRNPKKINFNSNDDGLSKCGQIWVNELRLTDFDEYGGWAANSRLTTKLADFGNVTASGSISTIGFGSIEKKVNERQKFNLFQYDVSSSFDLGKFFPEKYGVKIPLYMGISEAFKNPQYNPLDPDILFSTSLNTLEDKQERDSLKNIAQDYIVRKSINLTNVRKTKSIEKSNKASKPKIYDLENFTVSYSKNETKIRNINTEYNNTVNYKGALTYNYNIRPKNIKPFSSIKSKSPYLRIIKDFNINTMPKSFSFRTDIDRNYNETKLRNINNSNMLIFPTYNKIFSWNRMYEMKYDISRSLKLDYAVNVKANIDEPSGRISRDDRFYEEKIDTIWNNVWKLGRTTNYRQTMNINYQVPLNKIPITNFMSLNTRYNSTFNWTAAPLSMTDLGNTIQNSRSIQYNGQINLNNLYNKVPYFRKINQRNSQKKRIKNSNEESDENKDRYVIFKHITRFALGLKNISINYSTSQGTLMPGFRYNPNLLGNEWSNMAPGLPFTFGSQNDIRIIASSNNWIVQNSSLNSLYKTNSSNNLNLRGTFEPFNKFRIELNANKTTSNNLQEYFRWDDENNIYNSFSPTQTGNYSISFISFRTAFSNDDENYLSSVFSNFRGYRADIANRLAAQNPNFNGGTDPNTGFPIEYQIINNDTIITGGYGPTSQEVIIPAFLAAYSGKSPLNIGLTSFPAIPLPNWRINYDGLMTIPYLKRRFRSILIAHAYRSTYTVGSYSSNLNYVNGDEVNVNNLSYHVEKEIAQVTINEQFSPLFKLDLVWKNSLLTKIEFKRSRLLSLSLVNSQLTETQTKEYVISAGYRISDLNLNFISSGRGKKISSDLDLKLDVNIRNNKTMIRKIIEDVEQITMGQQIVSIKFSTDYVVNRRLNLKLFYDRVITNPFVSTTFPSAITNAGFSLRFTLAG